MQPFARSARRAVSVSALLLTSMLFLTGCHALFDWMDSEVDLEPFRARAAAAGCSDIRNRLFLIDDELVFWDVAGNCADASYGYTLFGSTPDDVLCTAHDSIAGPMMSCADEQYRELFQTMIDHLDDPDLGLGPEHIAQPVPL